MVSTGRRALLEAFDRLFAKAASKLSVSYTEEELAAARAHFERRFAGGLEAAGALRIEKIPEAVVEEMERAIDDLSAAEVIGHLAAIPLAHKAQEMLRLLDHKAAERRLLEYAMEQADDAYGGN